MSLVLIYELTIQVRSLPFLLAWTPQSPLFWHIWDPCGTLFTIRVPLEYEKWEMSRSVWEVVEVKSGLRQPDISAPLQTNDPPHRRKEWWLGQFQWIILIFLSLFEISATHSNGWLKAWYKCQRCGSEKEDDGAQLKNFSNLTLFLVTNHITLDSTTALFLPTVFLYGTCSTSSPTFYIFTQPILHFHSAQLFSIFTQPTPQSLWIVTQKSGQILSFNGMPYDDNVQMMPIQWNYFHISERNHPPWYPRLSNRCLFFVFVFWHVTTLTPIIKLFVPLLKNQVKSSEQENINVKIVLSP